MRRSFVSSLLALSLLAAGCGGSKPFTAAEVKTSYAQEGAFLNILSDPSDGDLDTLGGRLPAAEDVLLGQQNLGWTGPGLIVYVYRSEADAIQAEVGVRLFLVYLSTLPRLFAPTYAVARHRNVLTLYLQSERSERLVQTALAQLRCVPYC
jgi:hypothetical protein